MKNLFSDPYKGDFPESMRRLYPSGRFERIQNLLIGGVLIALVAIAGTMLIQNLNFSMSYDADDQRIIGAVPPGLAAPGDKIVVNDDCEFYRQNGNSAHSHFGSDGWQVCTTWENFAKRPYLRQELGMAVAQSVAPLIPETPSMTMVMPSADAGGRLEKSPADFSTLAKSFLAEWSRVNGGNLHQDGVTDDIAEYMNGVYRDGPTRTRLREEARYGSPQREKLDILRRHGLVDEQRYRELLYGY